MGRVGGYAALRDYAVVGDGRSVALVGVDGSVDWLAWPDLDSPALFAGLLDATDGGEFTLAPAVPFRATRRYLPDTNVLETTFHTGSGTARLVDLMSLRGRGLEPARELQRRVDGIAGRVPMCWRARPRFDFGARATRLGWRAGVPVATAGRDAVAVCAYGAGTPAMDGAGAVYGRFDAEPGTRAVVALCAAHQEPLVIPTRSELDARHDHTVSAWNEWTGTRSYRGPWRDAVLRSALVLKLLVFAPSGAVAAAATTSLPEQIGGERNWDYRFSWVRDAVFTLDALSSLGCTSEARAYFWWLMHATQLTHPRLLPLYRLDGAAHAAERILPLAGYRRSRPVRIGNAAVGQLQLDCYGELLQTAWLYATTRGGLDRDIGRRLGGTAEFVCQLWRQPDAGIWESRDTPAHYTHSKMMCWVALDRAVRLADRGLVPDRYRGHWEEQAAECRRFIEENCFSPAKGSYLRAAGATDLDSSVLLGLIAGYGDPASARWRGTVEAVHSELGRGPHLHRYLGADGLPGAEGGFVCCAFWLAEALARTGRVDEASALMDELVGLANDVGLYAEQMDPETGAFLGNLPQGLSHLALISAATAIAERGGGNGRCDW